MDGNNSTKGYGLKKWRRIPRDVREPPSSSAKAVVLKRLLSAPVSEGSKSSSAPFPPMPAAPKLAHGKKPRGESPSNGNANAQDPLRNSLLALQSLHDALATEVDKFGAMGTDPVLRVDELVDTEEAIVSRGRVDKLSGCFFIQLILFVFVVWNLVSSPPSTSPAFVPT